MSTFSRTETFNVIHCSNCGLAYALTADFMSRRRNDHKSFYCPVGHSQYFPGKSEAEKLREQLSQTEHQRDRARMNADELRHERDTIAKAHRKMRVRVMNGVCPCCNRSFEDLRQHMATKHPDFGQPQTIKALREAFGMTQTDVANEAGTKSAYVSLFERGRPVPAEARDSLTWWMEKHGVAA